MVRHDTKFAEKLSILTHHSVGILTRLYSIKQTFQNPETRPAFLQDKAMEPLIKGVVKKFPLLESGKHLGGQLQSRRTEINKALESFYFTMVDVLEFKDVAADLINSLGTSITSFHLANNFHLTKGFLDLLVNYASALVILSRIEDRKTLAALYAVSHEHINNNTEPNFNRLAQWLVDYEQPLRKLPEDFQSISKSIASAIMSCQSQYARFHVPAANLRQQNALNILASGANILAPAQSPEVLGETLVSLDRMTTWIVVGFLIVPSEIEAASDLLRVALIDGFVTPLFRDETLSIHAEYEAMASAYKATGKLTKVKQLFSDCAAFAVQSSGSFHKERRVYLRQSLQQLILFFSDKPGILGPKSSTLFTAMSLARDEILWYFRHFDAQPPKTKTKFKEGDYQDFHITELVAMLKDASALVKQHEFILKKYFLEYLATFDLDVLRDTVSAIPCPEEESLLITSFVDTLSALTPAQFTQTSPLPTFSGLRLDWFRLQALMSVNKAPVPLVENPELILRMNTVIFHTFNVDGIDDILKLTASLATLWCYRPQLVAHFEKCINTPRQCRFAYIYPTLCGEFPSSCHEFLPEERVAIGASSAVLAQKFLEHIAAHTAHVVHYYCIEHVKMGRELLPVEGANQVISNVLAAKGAAGGPSNARKGAVRKGAAPGGSTPLLARSQQVISKLTDIHYTLSDLHWAVNHDREIKVFDTVFCPREFLIESLSQLFSTAVVKFMSFRPEEHVISRPSQLLQEVLSYMEGIFSLENYVDINMLEVFYTALQEQTQLKDKNGKLTVASGYSSWYMDFLTRGVDSGNFCFSPIRKSFVSRQEIEFKAEEFTDLPELMALCQLVGPYGVRSLDEMIMKILSAEVGQIKGYVMNNQEGLQVLQKFWHDPVRSTDVLRKLKNVEDLITRSLRIGVLLSFRSLLSEASALVLQTRAPLIYNCVQDLHQFFPDTAEPDAIDRISIMSGIVCDIDPFLCTAMKDHCGNPDYDFKVWNLLLVFYAASLCNLACKETSVYKPALEANSNNASCLSIVIHNLSSALLSLTANTEQHIPDCQKEFLTIASVLLLRLRNENEKELPKELESIIILLDSFVQSSPFLNSETLEACLPYGLLQTAYNELYRRRPPERKNVGGF